jgi:hypothetical protein
MEQFWISPLGELTGKPEDAYTRQFKQIPDDTLALAQIAAFTNEEHEGKKHLKIDWVLTDGDFTGQHVFQKLHVFDDEPKKRHRSLNLLMLMYKTYNLSPKSKDAPSNADLMVFKGKEYGIKIQLTEPNDKGKQYTWVSEIHPVAGFKCETGNVQSVVHHVDTALSRNADSRLTEVLEDDIPFK